MWIINLIWRSRHPKANMRVQSPAQAQISAAVLSEDGSEMCIVIFTSIYHSMSNRKDLSLLVSLLETIGNDLHVYFSPYLPVTCFELVWSILVLYSVKFALSM